MKTVKILSIGKIRASHFKDAAAHYRKLLGRFIRIEEIALKDTPGSLSPEERKKLEGEAILAKLAPTDQLICLDEHGKTMTSRQLSTSLEKLIEGHGTPVFVLGGPYGLSEAVLDRARLKLSLSPMTFPHELAKVILLEQIYRAISIQKNLPYHND